MPKVSNTIIYPQDDNLSMDDYTIGTNSNTGNKKTQTYAFKSIFSLFYNFLGYNAFFNTTDTTTYPIGTPGCFYVFDESNALTADFSEARKITFSAYDTYNFDTANYFNIIVNSEKFLFKLINLEDKNNFVFLSPSNFVLGGTGTTFNVDVLAESGLSNGSFVNYKRYLLVLEFAAGTFNPADYDLSDFTNISGDPFITAQDLTNALALLPAPIENHSELTLDDGSNPHGTTKTDVGLGNVDNTSDVDKPISLAAETAFETKLDKSTTPLSVYATDESGDQVMKLISELGGTSKKTQIVQFAWGGGNYSANANWWRINNGTSNSKYNFAFNQTPSVNPSNAFANDTNFPFHERLMFDGKIKEIYIEGSNNGVQWNCDFALRNFELTGYNAGIPSEGVTNNQIVAQKQFPVGTISNINRSFTLGTDIFDLTLPKFSVLRPYFKSEGVANSNWQNVVLTILIEEV